MMQIFIQAYVMALYRLFYQIILHILGKNSVCTQSLSIFLT